ncbi:DUF6783 domain-containing protein [Fusicatenibacter sp.]
MRKNKNAICGLRQRQPLGGPPFAKWGLQLAEMIFQTRSGKGRLS